MRTPCVTITALKVRLSERMKNISNSTIWAAVIGLVVGLVLGWLIGHNTFTSTTVVQEDTEATDDLGSFDDISDEGDRSSSSNALTTNSSPSAESDSVVMVVDQGAGGVVSVASVETDASVWVVVREDKNGVLGNILGATRIDAGNSNNVVVNLLRPTVAGQVYQVVLFADDGDKKFDHKIDVPLTLDGTLIARSFKALAQ